MSTIPSQLTNGTETSRNYEDRSDISFIKRTQREIQNSCSKYLNKCFIINSKWSPRRYKQHLLSIIAFLQISYTIWKVTEVQLGTWSQGPNSIFQRWYLWGVCLCVWCGPSVAVYLCLKASQDARPGARAGQCGGGTKRMRCASLSIMSPADTSF